MNVSGRSARMLTAIALPALAGAVGACGSGGGTTVPGPHGATPHPRPGAPAAATSALHPAVGGRRLLALQRLGVMLGASDLVEYGSDGSAVIVQEYGGGGLRVRRCRLRAGELARLRRDLRRLPLGQPVHTRARKRSTLYTPPPVQYTLRAGRDTETFTENAMPPDARPLVRRLRQTMDGHAATCRTTYQTRAR